MRRAWVALLAGAAVAGCHSPAPVRVDPPAVTLPTAPRALPAPTVLVQASAAVPADPPAPAYHPLTADECRRLACRQATAARVIEAAARDPDRGLSGRAALAHVRHVAAAHLARDVRNRTAAAALELYFQLQEVELLDDVLGKSEAELSAAVAAADALIAQGARPTAEMFAVRKSRVEARAERARARAGIDRLNAELKGLLGLEATTPGRLLPAEPVAVTGDLVDVDRAVALGLSQRAELNLLRDLAAGLDGRTVTAVRQALAGLAPPLAAVTTAVATFAPGLRALVPAVTNPSVDDTRRLLLAALRDREQAVAREVRSAVLARASAGELAGIAQGKLDLDRGREAELKRRREAGEAVAAAYQAATLDALRSEAEFVRAAVAWQRADVKAREAMGLLCPGFTP